MIMIPVQGRWRAAGCGLRGDHWKMVAIISVSYFEAQSHWTRTCDANGTIHLHIKCIESEAVGILLDTVNNKEINNLLLIQYGIVYE